MMSRKRCYIFFFLGVFFTLVSCQKKLVQDKAPIINASFFPQQAIGYHKVLKGETLHSIAKHYGLKISDVALTNHLKPPYIIHPGQFLSLGRKKVKPRWPKQPKQVLRFARKNKTQKVKPVKQVATKTHTQLDKKSRAEKTQPVLLPAMGKTNWQWPAKGKVVSQYGKLPTPHHGIDIAGKLGSDIRAAASGKVVYSGSGLKGYGQLVIIQHKNQLLSAYGHNHKLFVKEGDFVKKGQRIAQMGEKSPHVAVLHFEIRRYGRPVDPNLFLPKIVS